MNQEEREQFQELGEAWEDIKSRSENLHPKYVDWLIEIINKQEEEIVSLEKRSEGALYISNYKVQPKEKFEL
ncbi:hypothetical protein PQ478_09090 [Alkalihalophilus pseudofirmus]|uniref:hypothetical protein n=1 Tax=Alkalihalophilus pseudofirmus TaxID=79885 RepID=UPI00259B18D4|nr:hypothetical protein [Alkalihalophilus pseudofirmus]WEG18626.1 hypothetical protein PQ478_09090 [Alkalihalophilus pseudofirmus]